MTGPGLAALRGPGRRLVEEFRETGRVRADALTPISPGAIPPARWRWFWLLRIGFCLAIAVVLILVGPT
jgi:hypothetical protein